jgi:hypothetical protein
VARRPPTHRKSACGCPFCVRDTNGTYTHGQVRGRPCICTTREAQRPSGTCAHSLTSGCSCTLLHAPCGQVDPAKIRWSAPERLRVQGQAVDVWRGRAESAADAARSFALEVTGDGRTRLTAHDSPTRPLRTSTHRLLHSTASRDCFPCLLRLCRRRTLRSCRAAPRLHSSTSRTRFGSRPPLACRASRMRSTRPSWRCRRTATKQYFSSTRVTGVDSNQAGTINTQPPPAAARVLFGC